MLRQVLPSLLALALTASTLAAQQGHPLPGLRDAGFAALQRGDRTAAVQAADTLVAEHATDPVAWRLAGDLYLRAGKVPQAVAQFQRYVQRVPQHEPELWQYGIALALSGDYAAGQKLFEQHGAVNPNDVENSLWHFYCIAKASTAEQARRRVLPAPNDPRAPLEPLLWLYRGEGDAARVWAAVETLPADSRRTAMANFYANLYLAMHAEAVGKRQQALVLAERAAATREVNYMTDVGRVYYELLRDAAP